LPLVVAHAPIVSDVSNAVILQHWLDEVEEGRELGTISALTPRRLTRRLFSPRA
jgi:hypothetical protein